MTSSNTSTSTSNGIVRSRSPDPYQSSHKRSRPRRHTVPAKFLHHRNVISHPYFSQHAHHLCTSDNSVDTSLLNEGIVFYQNPNSGEMDYYWENELDTCAPSLMPENTEMLAFNEISGDSSDLEETYFQIMAKELSRQNQTCEAGENLSPAEIVCSTETILGPTNDADANADDTDAALPREEIIENEEFDLDDLVTEMNELLNGDDDDDDRELKEREEEEPPSPLSPRDPEREGPALSEEEENTEEGAFYRLEHDSEFQDEAGLENGDDSGSTVWSDDEGMDPMENQ